MRKIQASLKRKQSQRFNTDSVDYRILVAGLESSGKSSVVSMIVNKEADHETEPTRGVAVSAFTSKPLSTNPKTVIFHEIGGHSSCRGLMRYYYKCDAVIFVVDSSDHEHFTKERAEEKQLTVTRTPNGSDSSSSSSSSASSLTSTLITVSSTTPPTNTHGDTLQSAQNALSPNTPISPTPSTTALSLMPPFSPSDTEMAEDIDPEHSMTPMTEGFVRRRSNGILRPNLSVHPNSKSTTKSSDKPRSRLSGLFTLSLPTMPPVMQRSASAAIPDTEGSSRIQRAHTQHSAQRSSDVVRRRITLNSNRGTSLKPLTMNEAKCDSVQELISKINYDIRDLGVPFLVLLNKADDDDPMSLNEHRISSALRFDRIIDSDRLFNCFPCSAFHKESVNQAFNWLLDTLKRIEVEKRQNSKLLEVRRKLETMDLDKFGPNAKDPRCTRCDEPCKHHGSFCSVCGTWMCERDAMEHLVKRKSGNVKCRGCVGQVSIFGKDVLIQ